MTSAKILVYVEDEPSEKKVLRVPLEQLQQGECVSAAIMRLFDPSGLKYVPGAFEIKCLNADEEETGVLASAEQVVNAGRYMLKPVASAHVMEKQRAAFLQSVPTATISATTLTVEEHPSHSRGTPVTIGNQTPPPVLPLKVQKVESSPTNEQLEQLKSSPTPVVVDIHDATTSAPKLDPALTQPDVVAVSDVLIAMLSDNIVRHPERLARYVLKGAMMSMLSKHSFGTHGKTNDAALDLAKKQLQIAMELRCVALTDEAGPCAPAYILTETTHEVLSLATRIAAYAFLVAVMKKEKTSKEAKPPRDSGGESELRLNPKFGATAVEGKAILKEMAKYRDKETLRSFLKFHQVGDTGNEAEEASIASKEKDDAVNQEEDEKEGQEEQQAVLVSVTSDDEEDDEQVVDGSVNVMVHEQNGATQPEEKPIDAPPVNSERHEPTTTTTTEEVKEEEEGAQGSDALDEEDEDESFTHQLVRSLFATAHSRVQLLHWCTVRGVFFLAPTVLSGSRKTWQLICTRPDDYPRVLPGGTRLEPTYLLPEPTRRHQESFDTRTFQASPFLCSLVLDGSVSLNPYALCDGFLDDDYVSMILSTNERKLSLFDERAPKITMSGDEPGASDDPSKTNALMMYTTMKRTTTSTTATAKKSVAKKSVPSTARSRVVSSSSRRKECNRCGKLIPISEKFAEHNIRCRLANPDPRERTMQQPATSSRGVGRRRTPSPDHEGYPPGYNFNSVSRGKLKCKECGVCIPRGMSVGEHLDRSCRRR